MGDSEKTPDKIGRIGFSRKNSDQDGPPTAEAPPPHIPPGEYQAECVGYKTGRTFKGRRDIFINFVIYGGEYDGIPLFMACTYPKGALRPRHKYHLQWTLAARRLPRKREPLDPKIFVNCVHRVRVRFTTRRHADGTLMPEYAQYSVVDTIIEPTTRGPIP